MNSKSEFSEPAVHASKRQALLESARYLFTQNNYSNISIRRIADHAGVNSALISYYFGSKEGLFKEVLNEFMKVNIDRIQLGTREKNHDTLEETFRYIYQQVPSEFIQMVVRTVLFERSEIRDWILQNLMKRILASADQYFHSLLSEYNNDVQIQLIRTSFQSLLIGPKLLEPMLKEVQPEIFNEDFFTELAGLNATMISNYIRQGEAK